ncbi:MAG TPA: hypothetical protein VHL34_20265 [Rhizomicrobium sp.]|nr:hypothetical protein [Rhizomicrobium sp.]
MPIELRLNTLSQLFQSLDPYRFRERDLDRNAEEFIVTWARELPSDGALEILIHLPSSEARGEGQSDIQSAISRHFSFRAEEATQDLREQFAIGRIYLVMGLSVLTACMLSAQLIERLAPAQNWTRVVAEGLVILGWVTNWRPAEILLFESLPIYRRRRLMRRLATARVIVMPIAAA